MATIFDKYTAGYNLIGFDYQFYYFMLLALDLKTGQKVGFEVKDDVNIDLADGTTILFQTKHSINEEGKQTTKNLTTLDVDLWKTLSNWSDMINVDKSILHSYSFYLVTNKGEGNNDFIEAHSLFKKDTNIDNIIGFIEQLKDKTQNREIKAFIRNVLKLGKKNSKSFFTNLIIETDFDNIIEKIKLKIRENIKNRDLVDTIFDSLSANMSTSKYLDIKDRKKFEITFDDFEKRFGKCFRPAFKDKPLPKRTFPIRLPEKLEEQIFIKQLIDIGDISSGSSKVIDYTTKMFQTINQLSYWSDNNFLLPTEMDVFQKEAFLKWENEFLPRSQKIDKKIKSGISINELESEIQDLGLEIIYYLRKEDLTIAEDKLGIALSHGHYYALSDKPEIGWHYDWKRKYKSE